MNKPHSFTRKLCTSIILIVNGVIALMGQNLFISTYLENGSNKCIQLFNPTFNDITLTGSYDLRFYFNGGNTVTVNRLEGVIPARGTHTLCSGSLGVYSNESLGPAHNGNDGIVLEHNGNAIDIFGSTNCNPGTAWTVGGLTTENVILVRKPCVTGGNTSNSCNFASLGTEWVQYPPSSLGHLASHDFGLPDVSIQGPSALCDNPSITLSVQRGYQSYRWSTGNTTPSLIVTGAGNYTVTVTSSDGCQSVGSKRVNGASPPITASVINIRAVSCLPKEDGAFQIAASGGSGNFIYAWEGGETNSSFIDNVGAGTYDITITDGNGCTEEIPLSVGGPATIPLDVNFTGETCLGNQDGRINLTASGGSGQLQFSIDDAPFDDNTTFSNLAPDKYRVKVIDETGCGNQKEVIIEKGSRIVLGESIISQAKCLRDGGGQIILRPSGGELPYRARIGENPFQRSLVFSNLLGGTHIIELQDAKGCQKIIEQTINQGSDLDVIFTKEDATCMGLSDGSIGFEVTGGFGIIYHKIDDDIRPFFFIDSFDDLPVGKHRVTIGDSLFCEITEEFIIEENNPLQTTISTLPICEPNQTREIRASVEGGIAPYMFSLDSNTSTTTGIFDSVAIGVHEVTVRDSLGCSATDSIEITTTNPFEITAVNIKQDLCQVSAFGQIEILTNESTTQFSIDGFTFQTKATFDSLPPNNYSIIAKAGDCTDTTRINIEASTPLLIQCGQIQNVVPPNLANGRMTLSINSGTAPYEIFLTNQLIEERILTEDSIYIFGGLPIGSYTVNVMDSKGCISNCEFSIQEILCEFSTMATVNDVSCYGQADGSVSLDFQNGILPYEILWSDTIYENTFTINNLAAGMYDVTVVDQLGCLDSLSVEVEAPDPISIDIISSDSIICGNDAVLLTVAESFSTYNWSNGLSTPEIIVEEEGNYQLTVFDEQGCSAADTILILAFSQDTIRDIQYTCNPTEVGTIHSEETNRNGCTNLIITTIELAAKDTTLLFENTCDPALAGVSTTFWTNEFGCDSIVISTLIFQNLDTTFITRATCNPNQVGNSQRIEVNQYGCDSLIYVETILSEESILNRQTQFTCQAEEAGIDTTFFLTIDGCDSLVIVETRLNSSHHISFIEHTCDSSLTGIDTFLFTNQSLCDSVVEIQTVLAASPVTLLEGITCDSSKVGYERVVLTNQFGCDSIIEINTKLNFFEDCAISFSVTVPTICADDLTGEVEVQPLSGNPPFSYWLINVEGTDTLSKGQINEVNQSIVINDVSIGNYMLQMRNEENYHRQEEIMITRQNPITIQSTLSDYLGFQVSCNNASDGSINIIPENGKAPYHFQWENNENNPKRENLSAGHYYLTITDALDCQLTSDFVLNAPKRPEVDFIIRMACSEESTGAIELTNISNMVGDIEYSLGGTFFEPISNFPFVHENLTKGIYSFYFQDDNDCQVLQTFEIGQVEALQLELGNNIELRLGDSLQLSPNANFEIKNWIWQSAMPLDCMYCPTINVLPTHNTIIQLEAFDNNGCSATDQVTINISKESQVYLPNIFSPNNDGLNDYYRLYAGKAVTLINQLQIVDYEGRLLYQIVNRIPQEIQGWDGYFNGQKMNPAVFIVFAEVSLIDGSIEKYTQPFNLIE